MVSVLITVHVVKKNKKTAQNIDCKLSSTLAYVFDSTLHVWACTCCGSILSLVEILFSFVLGYGNV